MRFAIPFLLLASSAFAQSSTSSSIQSNFNGTSIAGGDYIWFSAVFKPTTPISTTTTTDIYITNQTISVRPKAFQKSSVSASKSLRRLSNFSFRAVRCCSGLPESFVDPSRFFQPRPQGGKLGPELCASERKRRSASRRAPPEARKNRAGS